MEQIEKRTIGKVMTRLVPFLVLCYFVAYLDRVNVGFAKLQMDTAIGLDETAYAIGAGVFFWAYFLVEVPSNLALNRFGARVWIARIMISWGIVSGCFAFIPSISHATGISSPWVFYILRFLLGLCEAGFYPGVIFYLTLWFPAVYRARVLSLFMLAIPFAAIIGGPVSGQLLGLTGVGGFEGWQWLFLIEAVPSVLLGFVVLLALTDFPGKAKWLAQDEKDWLQARLEGERKSREGAEHFSILKAIIDPRVLACSAIYFCLNAASYGTAFFLPSIIKEFGVSDAMTGVLSAVPFVFGAIGMILLGRNSDRTLKRKEHVAFALGLAFVGIGLAGYAGNPVLEMALLCLAQIGISAMPPLFWPLPTSLLSGASAAAGIAAINSIGNLSGFFGPTIMGKFHDLTGSYTSGLSFLAVCALIGAIIGMTLKIDPKREAVSGEPVMAH
jgi:MFS family permease